MYLKSAIIIIFATQVWAQNRCDYYQELQAGASVTFQSPNYPNTYPRRVQCRWIAVCPLGYNCHLTCIVYMPQTQSCYMDRLLVSRTGDPQLSSAETYCGTGTLDITSNGRNISVGLISVQSSPGGRFSCSVTPVPQDSSQCTCGETKKSRIVGGYETGVNEYNMMAALANVGTAQIKCGATIISQHYVVTAAHCVDGESTSGYAIVVGEHNISTNAETPGTAVYGISLFQIHPLFNSDTNDYDIALVRSESTIEFNSYVGPVCLPFSLLNANLTGVTVTLLGWGLLATGYIRPDVLQQVQVKVISQQSCARAQAQVGQTITNRQICTYAQGKDACQNDSGGPNLYFDKETGLVSLVGVISNGAECAQDGLPGVNTRVANMEILSWILATTGERYCVKG